MATRTIRVTGEAILRKKSKPVKIVNNKIITLLEDMRDTMAEADGVGLAAVQVGVLRRIFLAEVGDEEAEDPIIEFINPEILVREGSQVNVEGCLSVPNESGHVERPTYVKIKTEDRTGKEHIYEFEDYNATVICHEYDHLEGVLYTDKIIQVEEEEPEEAEQEKTEEME